MSAPAARMAATLGGILAAGSSRGERWLQSVVYGLLLLVAVLMAVLLPARGRLGEMLVLVLSLPTFFLWMGWFSRLLVLRAHAGDLQVPALPRAIDLTLAVLVLATVLLPALWIGAVGAGFAWALSCLACVAASGLLLALLPRGLVGLVGLLPMLVASIGGDSLGLLVDAQAAMPALAGLLVLLAAWRWLRIARDIGRWQAPGWQQPLVFAMGRRAAAFGAHDLLDPKLQEAMVPRWWRRGADLRACSPGEVRTMRVLLGGVFAPVGWKQRLAGAALYLALLVLAVRYFGMGHEDPWQMLLFMGLFAGAVGLVVPFAVRLQGLQQAHGGELAELSLLPGWGDAAQARQVLARAVAQVFGRAAAAMLLLMLGAAWMTGRPLELLLALVATLAVIALGVVAWLRPLAGRPWRLDPWVGLGALVAGVPLLGCTVVAFGGGGWVPAMLVAWSLLLLGAHWPALRLWQAFERRPQPFLMR